MLPCILQCGLTLLIMTRGQSNTIFMAENTISELALAVEA